MVNIIQAYIPKHNRNRPRNRMKPLYITVHNTSNTAKGANAGSHAAFVARSSTGVSCITLSTIRSFISIYH